MRMDAGPPAQPQNGCEKPLIEIDGSGITGMPAYMNGSGIAWTRAAAPRAETARKTAVALVPGAFRRIPFLSGCSIGRPLPPLNLPVPCSGVPACAAERLFSISQEYGPSPRRPVSSISQGTANEFCQMDRQQP